MDNEALKTILRLQDENTIYRRVIQEASGLIAGVISTVPLTGDEEIDSFLTEIHQKLSPKKEGK